MGTGPETVQTLSNHLQIRPRPDQRDPSDFNA